ncbi:MAG TPA: hypothetical protein VMT67_08675 [Terriglobales bacterium]|nr:hypothetical protein [Terriglobales bacterium]
MGSVAAQLPQNSNLLQDLLHSLSQPLTTLHCALEHSLGQDDPEHPSESAFALEQTDRVIELVRLMREYVDAETGCFLAAPFPLGLAVENVLEQISVLAEVRGLRLFAYGTSTVSIPVRGAWLQRALLYLTSELLNVAPAGCAVTILLEDGPFQSVLSAHCVPTNSSDDPMRELPAQNPEAKTAHQVKIEIARRVLANSGASLDFYSNGQAGFVIRVPKHGSDLSEIPA